MSGPGANGAGATGGAVEHHRVAIVGSGFAGLGMAIRCKQEGIEDFVILERGDDVGGTWRVNTYPGCQCDVPSHLYSFSFMPNPDWSRTYSNQPEIWDYLRRCAVDGNILGHLRLNCELRGATWVEERRHWRLQTSQGELTADVLVAGSGPLTEPSVPAIAGLESFQGAVFHSADWDHDQELAGKRVAVVGTGASSIQFVPEIQPQVESMTLFQRTPPWVLPHRDRKISRLERLLYRVFPPAQKLARGFVYISREPLVLGLVHRPGLLVGLERLARKHLADQVADPELRRRLRPSYRIGCKRILQSNDWYPALTKPNVEVVTAGISEVRENGVVDADGRLHEVDAIILGTGFNVFDPPIAHRIRGRDQVLSEAWERGMEAYYGAAVAGFPNFFLIVGPNTGLGHNSMVFMIESQLNYVLDCLRTMEARGAASVEVRPAVQSAYNEELHRRLEGTVWNAGGCASWYIDAQGRNRSIWPRQTWTFRRRTRRFDVESYLLEAANGSNGSGSISRAAPGADRSSAAPLASR